MFMSACSHAICAYLGVWVPVGMGHGSNLESVAGFFCLFEETDAVFVFVP